MKWFCIEEQAQDSQLGICMYYKHMYYISHTYNIQIIFIIFFSLWVNLLG